MIDARLYGVSASVGGEINRIGIEAATAEGCKRDEKVQLPDGVLDVAPRPGSGQGYCIEWYKGKVRLLAGPNGTTIRHGGNTNGIRNQLFRITGGSGYEFGEGGGLILDGSSVTGATGDQNHLLEINTLKGTVDGVKLFDMILRHSGGYVAAPGAISTGDGIRTVGGAVDKIKNIEIYRTLFSHCGRSGISTNRGSVFVTLRDCTFEFSSDQDYDTESSDGADIENVSFINCIFGVSMVSGGACISLGGAVRGPMRNLLFENCFMPAPVQGGYIDGLTLRKCTIDLSKVPSQYGSLTLLSRNKNILVDDCDIWHYAENGNVAAVYSYAQYNEHPNGIKIVNSRIRQFADTHAIRAESTDGFEMDEGSVLFDGASNGQRYGLWLRSNGVHIGRARVNGTDFAGTPTHRLLAAIGTTPDPGWTMGNMDFDNIGVQNSLWALDTRNVAADYANKPCLRGARLGPGVGHITQSSVQAPGVITGGTRAKGAVRSISRWGTPEGVELGVIGSHCIDRQTGLKYFKSTGTPAVPTKTGWVLIV